MSSYLCRIILVSSMCLTLAQVNTGKMSKSEVLMRLRLRGREGMYDNLEDYEYEIIQGHPRHDEKVRRQAGCMCYEHYYDPHCGSDMKLYDNGCYFMCAQERDKSLTLYRWGTCDATDDSGKTGSGGHVRGGLVEMDYDFDAMDE